MMVSSGFCGIFEFILFDNINHLTFDGLIIDVTNKCRVRLSILIANNQTTVFSINVKYSIFTF